MLYFLFFWQLLSSSPLFASSCKHSVLSSATTKEQYSHRKESYRKLLVRLAKSSLGVNSLSPQQVESIEIYHHVVQEEAGKDGTFVRVGNYTFSQIKKIIKFLHEVFSPEQVKTLIEDGVVEINRSSDFNKLSRRILTHFNGGKKVFIQLGSKVFRISKILKKTNSGFLVETERVDWRSNRIIREKNFLISNNKEEFLDVAITKITWKMSGQLVIFVLNGVIKLVLNSVTPFNWKNTLYWMTNKITIGDDKTHYDFITDSLRKAFLKNKYKFRLANPESEAIFLAFRSNKKRIDFDDLNLSSSTNKESQLTRQGYKANYVGGIDHVDEWALVREMLLEANPLETHVKDFEKRIPVHIAYIREGIKNNYPPNEYVKRELKLLKLEKEAQQAILNEKVTYKWWLEFNFKLARLMNRLFYSTILNIAERRYIRDSLHFFPLMTVIPAIQKTENEDLGIITFNRAGFEGVYPAGLIGQKTTDVGGWIPRPSSEFLGHDIFHSEALGNRLLLEYSAGHRLFHKRLLVNIESLPPEKRKKAEAVYILMTRENFLINNISYSDWTPQQMREAVTKRVRNSNAGIFKFSNDPVKKKKKIEDITDTFMEVYNKAQQHIIH